MRTLIPIALLAVVATPGALAADEIPREIGLAETEIAGWGLVAGIDVDRASYPQEEAREVELSLDGLKQTSAWCEATR